MSTAGHHSLIVLYGVAALLEALGVTWSDI